MSAWAGVKRARPEAVWVVDADIMQQLCRRAQLGCRGQIRMGTRSRALLQR